MSASDATRAEGDSPTLPKAERVTPKILINVFYCRSNRLFRKESGTFEELREALPEISTRATKSQALTDPDSATHVNG